MVEFQIVEPHRSKIFGSSVGFSLVNEDGSRSIRILMVGTNGQQHLEFGIHEFDSDRDTELTYVEFRQLDLPRDAVGRIKFNGSKKTMLRLRIDSQHFVVPVKFKPTHFVAHIHNADGWVRIVDNEAIA